jgi:ssRNA-specific RNase YbeY (16S rRNA maturation enzyme)
VLQSLEKVIKEPQEGIIHLIVIPSEEMARMNEQFRGKKGPTDILTFSYRKSSENV